MRELFHGGQQVKRLSWREIQEMKNNMKKVKDIEEKSKQYHKKEENTLEQLLEQIDE